LEYSTAMNSTTAGLAANYQVDWAITKRIKKKTATQLNPVALTASYDATTHIVRLTIQGNQKFAKGGQIKVSTTPPSGMSSAWGFGGGGGGGGIVRIGCGRSCGRRQESRRGEEPCGSRHSVGREPSHHRIRPSSPRPADRQPRFALTGPPTLLQVRLFPSSRC